MLACLEYGCALLRLSLLAGRPACLHAWGGIARALAGMPLHLCMDGGTGDSGDARLPTADHHNNTFSQPGGRSKQSQAHFRQHKTTPESAE
eukprot:15480095-Alexandrium_andersonii.AAC.1